MSLSLSEYMYIVSEHLRGKENDLEQGLTTFSVEGQTVNLRIPCRLFYNLLKCEHLKM